MSGFVVQGSVQFKCILVPPASLTRSILVLLVCHGDICLVGICPSSHVESLLLWMLRCYGEQLAITIALP